MARIFRTAIDGCEDAQTRGIDFATFAEAAESQRLFKMIVSEYSPENLFVVPPEFDPALSTAATYMHAVYRANATEAPRDSRSDVHTSSTSVHDPALHGGPFTKPRKTASWPVRRPLLTPQTNPGSRYRCGKSSLRAACWPRQEERGPEIRPKR